MVQSKIIENRYRLYTGKTYDANVRAWIDARVSVNDPPSAAWANAVDRAAIRLKSTPSLVSGVSNWSAIDTLVIPFQCKLLAGAIRPIKGVCTNTNFVQGDLTTIGLKGRAEAQTSLGLGTSRVTPNSSMGVWAWGSFSQGGAMGRVSNLCIQLLGSSSYSVSYRSFSSSGILYPAFNGLLAWSRLNSNEVHVTNSRVATATVQLASTATPAAGPLNGFQVGNSFGWGSNTLGILWHGQAVNLPEVQRIFNEMMLPYFGG